MTTHIEKRRQQFADTQPGKVRRDDRRTARAAKSAFLMDCISNRVID